MDVDKSPTATAVSKQKPKKSTFKCTYCTKEFTSYQALGGHQYAHRNERRRQQDSALTSAAAAKTKAAESDHRRNKPPLLWVSGGSLIQKLPPFNPYRHRMCSYFVRSPMMFSYGGAVVDNLGSRGIDTTLTLGLGSNSSSSANNVGDAAALGIDLELRL